MRYRFQLHSDNSLFKIKKIIKFFVETPKSFGMQFRRDARKAKRKLKWKPVENINSLVDDMIKSEYQYLNATK